MSGTSSRKTGELMARNRENKELTYSQALAELEEIVTRIESEKVDVDALAEQVKRSAVLIRFCREKLKSTEEDVKKVLSEMEAKPVQGNSVEKDLGLL
jgi:exodeoxyribonuclease VII small subunit